MISVHFKHSLFNKIMISETYNMNDPEVTSVMSHIKKKKSEQEKF